MTNTTVGPLELFAQIVSAHVSSNTVEAASRPRLIQEVYRALSVRDGGASATAREKAVPAVPIKESVYPDYIVCL